MEGRVEQRMNVRRASDGEFCSKHLAGKDRIKALESMMATVVAQVERIPGIERKVMVGVGVVISAVVLATVLFASMDAFKSDAIAAQEKHERAIATEQHEIKAKIVLIEATGNQTAQDVAVVSAQLKLLREELRADRDAFMIYLENN